MRSLSCFSWLSRRRCAASGLRVIARIHDAALAFLPDAAPDPRRMAGARPKRCYISRFVVGTFKNLHEINEMCNLVQRYRSSASARIKT